MRFRTPEGADVRACLRVTDEVSRDGQYTVVLLNGCDEFDAASLLRRVGVVEAEIRLADRHDLLAGPVSAVAPVADQTHTAGRQ